MDKHGNPETTGEALTELANLLEFHTKQIYLGNGSKSPVIPSQQELRQKRAGELFQQVEHLGEQLGNLQAIKTRLETLLELIPATGSEQDQEARRYIESAITALKLAGVK